MRHFFNVIALVITVGIFFLSFYSGNIKITQEVLDLFPKTQDKHIIDMYQQFSNSRHVFVAIKGFSEESRDKLDTFLAEIQELPNVENIMTRTTQEGALEEFIMDNYLYIASGSPFLYQLYGRENQKKSILLTQKELEDRILYGLQNLQKQMQLDSSLSSGLITQDSESNNTKSNNTIEKNNADSMIKDDTFLTIFHPKDPLSLFEIKVPKPYILSAKDYGYMALVTLKDIGNEAIQETLQSFQEVAKKYPEIRYFSQNFMNVENLDLILSEVNFLLSFASIAFIVLYFVIIRIPLLTINTICTLIVANIIAILIVSNVYPKVTIMALSFGMGISNIAIDYMMHHNFFSLYANGKRVFNKPVFYGYITTIVGFGVCLFIPFPLLSQLSLYAMISLTLCYISFAFLYPRIGFSEPRLFLRLANLRFQYISSYWFLGVALCGFIFAFSHLRLDFDLSKLDYQNKPMLQERDFFSNAKGDTRQVLFSSNSLSGLLSSVNRIQQLFRLQYENTFIPLTLIPHPESLDKKWIETDTIVQENKKALLKALPQIEKNVLHRIKEDTSITNFEDTKEFLGDLFAMFKESYEIDAPPTLTLESLEAMGFHIVVTDEVVESKEGNTTKQVTQKRYYYLGLLDNKIIEFLERVRVENPLAFQEITDYEGNKLEIRSLQDIMDNLTSTIYTPMLIVLAIALCFMVGMLLLTARKAFLDSVVFIFFPLAVALCAIASHSELNIMHLFALLILVVVSIDYGIYSVKEGSNPRTAHAIFFSALTTGSSFGILIISKTKALNSFGEVIFVGMACILFMLVFHKPLQRNVF